MITVAAFKLLIKLLKQRRAASYNRIDFRRTNSAARI
jgi:hypothetical protein